MNHSLLIRPATPYDDAPIRQIVNIPIPGMISLSLQREPNFFTGAAIQTQKPEVYVMEQGGEIIGLFSIGKKELYWEGEVRQMRYFSDLRIAPAFRHPWTLIKTSRYFLEYLLKEKQPGITYIFSDNKAMLSYVERSPRLHAMGKTPLYLPAGEVWNYMIPISKKIKVESTMKISVCTLDDIADLQTFMNREAPKRALFPKYQLELMGIAYYKGLAPNHFLIAKEGNEIVGCLGWWNQKFCKQTIVHQYAPFLKILRPFYNTYASLVNGFRLPSAGEQISYVSLHSILCQDNKPEILKALLKTAYQHIQRAGFQNFLVSFDPRDPLMAAIKIFRHPYLVKGKCYWVGKDADTMKKLKADYLYHEVARF